MIAREDHTAAFAVGFFMANLLFVGIFYIALWGLFLSRYPRTSAAGRSHLRQSLAAASFSSLIFLIINLGIISTSGYESVGALIALEVYFMLMVPVFMLLGILAFKRAVTHRSYRYPVIGGWLNTDPEPV